MENTGRPTDYSPDYDEQVLKLCRLGATDKELADFFDVSEQTLNTWKKKHPSFLESIKEGKERSDAEIANSLFHRAKGYSHKDVHISNYQGEITQTEIIKHYPPDPTSCIFWLKNRRRNTKHNKVEIPWLDRTDHELTGKDGEPLIPADPMEIARSIAFHLNLLERKA